VHASINGLKNGERADAWRRGRRARSGAQAAKRVTSNALRASWLCAAKQQGVRQRVTWRRAWAENAVTATATWLKMARIRVWASRQQHSWRSILTRVRHQRAGHGDDIRAGAHPVRSAIASLAFMGRTA